MALWNVKGRANYAGAIAKNFDIVVESFDDHFDVFSDKKIDAIKAKYPDWDGIVVYSWKRID